MSANAASQRPSMAAIGPQQQMMSSEDPYGGFNDYDHAYDLENLYSDREFVQAVARSSYGRRPATAMRSGTAMGGAGTAGLPPGTATRLASAAQMGSKRMATSGAAASLARSGLMSRARTGQSAAVIRGDSARPMTAVRGAGYTSAGRKSTFDTMPLKPKGTAEEGQQEEENAAQLERLKKLEEQAALLLRESVFAGEGGDHKRALDKAKEAARQWRVADTLRKGAGEQQNMDLSWTVLLCLGQQKLAGNIPSEALHIFHTIVKDRSYVNGHRLKVNIGNIHFRKKDFPKALKYYRMALDQVPKVNQGMRTKIANNIGLTLVRLGRYEDAMSSFEDCLDQPASANHAMALNLAMAAYCLGSEEKMREAFQRLVDISPPAAGSEELQMQSQQAEEDVLAAQLLANDALAVWERRKRQQAERTILLAAKIISGAIGPSFSEGYSWCVECIRQSVYASLATELEMNKAVELLRQGRLDQAVEELLAFNSKADSKVASAASNNLALVSIVRGDDKLEDAIQYCEQALSLDRYNANALVNRGNVHFQRGQAQLALQCFREALQVEAGCVAAIFNSGLVCRSLGQLEEAKKHFFKLNQMLVNNVQVLIQLAEIYEQQGERAQALELYTQANSLAPTDPGLLGRLAALYEAEGDKAQAFQCHYDSFRHFPANIDTLRWLANYYLYAQFAEKAVIYFEKAALMEPNNPEWPMLMGGCQRRSGNFQRALELYKQVHRRFPGNVECLKFLVQMCKELRMPVEEREFTEKLARLEKIGQLRAQRESDSAGQRNQHSSSGGTSPSMVTIQRHPTRPPSSRNSQRNSSATGRAQLLLEGAQHFQAAKKDITAADLVWKEPSNSLTITAPRPMTGLRRLGEEQQPDVLFENDDAEELLPY